jgi:asparagine synthase (glutamine-hydrolysing)
VCGIAGIAMAAGAPVDEALLRRMTASLVHRGPDGDGLWIAPGIGLGHRRLRIIDLSDAGRQPMGNETGEVQVTFNGEIYNFQQLRPPLESSGHRFRSATDTEVMVHLYEELGPAMVGRLRGMFAFGLWDARARRLLLVRDRVGIKPLYYAVIPGGLAFASELKALLLMPQVDRALHEESLAYYLAFGYLPEELTPYRGIHKLRAGHTLSFEPDLGRPPRIERYWTLDDFVASPAAWPSLSHCVEAVREKLGEAVRLRMISDAPLGAFLSGGVDSSIVVSAMAAASRDPIRTFTIGFHEQEADERRYARAVVERYHTLHQEQVVTLDGLSALQLLAPQLDEPLADNSVVPTYYVCKMAREQVVVALSGDGGDEGFAGYTRYSRMAASSGLDRVPRALRAVALGPLERAWPQSARGKGWLQRARQDYVGRYLDMCAVFPAGEWRALLAPPLQRALAGVDPYDRYRAIVRDVPGEPLERLMRLDIRTYLPEDILQKVDKASMLVSLEARVPLLDHELLQLSFTMPLSLKMHDGARKAVLRGAGRGLAPDEVLTSRKQGFVMPLRRWFRGELVGQFEQTVLAPESPCAGLVDQAAARRLLEDHRNGGRDFGRRLWSLLMLGEWARRYL